MDSGDSLGLQARGSDNKRLQTDDESMLLNLFDALIAASFLGTVGNGGNRPT